jgi:hypothetical protein
LKLFLDNAFKFNEVTTSLILQVLDKLEDYLGELSELIPSEDRDDLMKGLEAIKLANTNKYPDGKNPKFNKRGVSYIKS